jgi:hypothetical protein
MKDHNLRYIDLDPKTVHKSILEKVINHSMYSVSRDGYHDGSHDHVYHDDSRGYVHYGGSHDHAYHDGSRGHVHYGGSHDHVHYGGFYVDVSLDVHL